MANPLQNTAIVLGTLLALFPSHAQTAVKSRSNPAKSSAPAASTYVGTQACSRCHLEIANHYAKASMGHSLTQITAESLKTISTPATFTDPKTNHQFTVEAKNGKLYQTESETDENGKQLFLNAHQLEWIIGTGENGFGALLRRDNYLFQAPLSYYSRAAHWQLSPGYQNEALSFNRAILPGCIYCHSGRPTPVANHPGQYAPQPFTQTSVGCENCHGPGSAHVEAMGNGESYEKGKDPTIVNPAHLTGKLSDDICMSCHQTGDTRVLQPGKTYQDFRPGQQLDKTVSIFQIPPTRENPPQDDHVEHYYSMSLSKCFRASVAQPEDKQMRCITCHDPHVEPTAAEAPAWFNGKCLSCHKQQSLPAIDASEPSAKPVHTATANCISCHMPKRDVVVISHSSITNHRILARPNEAFPEIAFQQTTAAMPDLIHLNRESDNSPAPSALARLQAYADLSKQKPQYTASWLKTLAELETSTPNNALVQTALGHRELQAHNLPQAITHLKQALQLDPTQTEAYVDLSEALDQSGQPEEAITAQKQAIALDPFVPALQKTLVFRLINGKHYEAAQAAMEHYLELFPEDDFMRKMLSIAQQP